MTIFRAIFEINSGIGKLWDLLGHFDKKDMVCLKNEQNLVLLFDECVIKPLLFTTVKFLA